MKSQESTEFAKRLAVFSLLLFMTSVVGQSLENGAILNGSVVSIPYEYTYLLPAVDGNIAYTFVNGTQTSNSSINELFQTATKAPFISYDDEFLDMLGPTPQITLIERRDVNFAYEAGIWIPERNVVWFTSSVSDGPSHFEVLNLADNSVRNVTTTGQSFKNPNGGYYFNGSVYFATFRDPKDYPGGVVKIDVDTLEASIVLNSYFGLRFDDIDDIAWATVSATGKSYMYLTQLPYAYLAYPGLDPILNLTNAVWRFDPQEKLLLPVIDEADIPVPNGVRATLDGKTLYVCNFGGQQFASPSNVLGEVSGPSVFKYDIDDDGFPVNRRLFSYTRQGGADGIHVDDAGRVWTGEGEGIVVRSPEGRVLGVFNVEFFNPDHPLALPLANFALAGDEVVVLGTNYLWTVKLAQVVATQMN